MDGSGCGLFVNTWIRDTLLALILISAVWAIRSSLPSDLWKRSQPLTLRATVDVVAEDRWILPHTVDDLPLAKPPLVNWLSALSWRFLPSRPGRIVLFLLSLLC